MANNKIEMQAAFCRRMMDKLVDSIGEHEAVRLGGTWKNHAYLSDCNKLSERGGRKTQIQQDIVRLRRELNQLSSMLED